MSKFLLSFIFILGFVTLVFCDFPLQSSCASAVINGMAGPFSPSQVQGAFNGSDIERFPTPSVCFFYDLDQIEDQFPQHYITLRLPQPQEGNSYGNDTFWEITIYNNDYEKVIATGINQINQDYRFLVNPCNSDVSQKGLGKWSIRVALHGLNQNSGLYPWIISVKTEKTNLYQLSQNGTRQWETKWGNGFDVPFNFIGQYFFISIPDNGLKKFETFVEFDLPALSQDIEGYSYLSCNKEPEKGDGFSISKQGEANKFQKSKEIKLKDDDNDDDDKEDKDNSNSLFIRFDPIQTSKSEYWYFLEPEQMITEKFSYNSLASVANITSSGGSDDDDDDDDDGLSTGALVGIIIGSVVGAIIILGLIYWFGFRTKKNNYDEF